jgi:rhomboid protease GluP
MYLASILIEKIAGRSWLCAIFVVSAFGGSLMSLLINPANMVSVGAPGAIMGLLASAFILSCRLPFHAGRTKIQMQLMQVLIPSLLLIANPLHGQRVDFAAHFGGLVGGLLMGWIVMKFWPKDSSTPRGQSLAIFLSSVGLLAFAFALHAVIQTRSLGLR